MKNLQIHNSRFITYSDGILTVDILGGVDVQQIERMICTLRISYQNYPPIRSTLDLYNDTQTDKLIRTLCNKWELQLLEVSKSVHSLITQLESYKLERLKYPQQQEPDFEPSEEEKKKATQFLKHKNLLAELTKNLNTTGILGEDENAVILFFALASYKFNNPFSVICLAKSGIGKSYILQKLSECMPQNAYSFHTKISANALYYFDSHQINGKALFIEDLEWTAQMLQPLATLQTQGRLVNTRATKDKDGMLHSTTFEVVANLCLLACAYSEKNFEEISLPFLCLHLNHTHNQDILVMEYQKRCKAGQIKTEEVKQAQQLLKSTIATLQNVSIINPFATLINLPEEVAYPRKSFLLLLNFIEVITYFFQYQREQIADTETGEVFVKTHPQDIELAFKLLKNNLFRRADELNTSARGFYNWLQKFLNEAKTNQFTALDIRKTRSVHPRTLNNYLSELKLFGYVQVVGGNKHREGFIYKLTNFGNQTDKQSKIEQSIQATLKAVWNEYNKENESQKQAENLQAEPTEQTPTPEPISETEPTKEPEKETEKEPAFFDKHYKRIRINEKEEHTYKLILQLEAEQAGREYLTSDITELSKRSQCIEARYLKTLWEQGKLNREWKDRQYYYTLATNQNETTTSSKQVSKTPLANSQSLDT
jgi:DNA-binding HxlR family transcriptional regulator